MEAVAGHLDITHQAEVVAGHLATIHRAEAAADHQAITRQEAADHLAITRQAAEGHLEAAAVHQEEIHPHLAMVADNRAVTSFHEVRKRRHHRTSSTRRIGKRSQTRCEDRTCASSTDESRTVLINGSWSLNRC